MLLNWLYRQIGGWIMLDNNNNNSRVHDIGNYLILSDYHKLT